MSAARNERRWLVWGCVLGLIVLTLLAVLYSHSLPPAFRRVWSLQFVPSRLVLPADLPSIHETSVLLCNRGTKDEHIRLGSCCGVNIQGELERYVGKGHCVRIPLSVEVRSPGVYRGAIFVYVPGVQSPVTALPIMAQAYESVFASTDTRRSLHLPALVRKAPGDASGEACVTLSVHSGFGIERIVSPADWLSVSWRKRDTVVDVCAKALPSAPEGKFNLDLLLIYRCGKRSGRDYIRIFGEVVSLVYVHPSRLSFGVVSLRQQRPASKEVQIILRGSRGKPLSFRATFAGCTTRAKRLKPGVYVVEIQFIPKRLGEIRGYVQCRQGDDIIYLLPISALVQP
ncbi:MAG: hypothetical protein KatS3mg022_1651 [Armatimonadota bacterium]|nr:MAG: hypothetical protein KatS3mg022_1651 [Armatimonadota bacterium]GIV19084.1 MAG: hypothetical protein KatS3mg023_0835 [Armatimonadota bacterium]